MAGTTLMALRRLFSWHAARDDDFRSPIVRGMRRTSNEARTRVLNDDELRRVWKAAEERADVFGYMVRVLLLTAARRNEVAEMKRAELDNGDWLIPAARAKGGREVLLPLSAKAQVLLAEMPNVGEWMFSADGARPYLSFTYAKQHFDAACGVTGWTIHDLRRTARSLLSRAGINADVAERCLAHKIGGIRGVYDRHSFYAEKKHAFEALAAQIERIVHPVDNVTALRGAMS
jgi:integrase